MAVIVVTVKTVSHFRHSTVAVTVVTVQTVAVIVGTVQTVAVTVVTIQTVTVTVVKVQKVAVILGTVQSVAVTLVTVHIGSHCRDSTDGGNLRSLTFLFVVKLCISSGHL